MCGSPTQLWSVKDGSLLKICSRDGKDGMDSLHGGWVTDLHFSKDNCLLVSTGGYIKVWKHADTALYSFMSAQAFPSSQHTFSRIIGAA